MNTVSFRRHSPVRMVAHRGVSGLETENTCAAFVAAGNRSYFGVETDVHVSADGRFIIFHDDNTQRVGLEDHVIEQTDAAILRAMTLTDRDGGGKTRSDLRIPLLSEYVRICRKYEKTCVLELKNPMTPQAIAGIVENIRAEGWLEQVIFISFAHENLVELRRLLPQARLQFLTGDAADEALLARLLPWRRTVSCPLRESSSVYSVSDEKAFSCKNIPPSCAAAAGVSSTERFWWNTCFCV